MLKKAKKTIEKYNMLEKGNGVVLGLSGGADSVALLRVLCALREKYALRLYAVHVNHGIRGKEADEDCLFCQRLCQKMNVEFFVREYDIPFIAKESGMGSEEAGRAARYAAFEEIRQSVGADKIAVAHNLNDNAETVVMRLCRGTGSKGLCGISPVRGRIIRPIIECGRDEIEKYLEGEGLSFRTDSTNLEDEYTRNRIRHNVLPVLEKEVNSSACANIAKAAEILSEEEEFIEEYSRKSLEKCILYEDDEKTELNAELFASLHSAVKKRVVRMAIERLSKSLKDVTYSHIEAAVDIFQGKTGRSCDLPYGLRAEKSYNKAVIRKNSQNVEFFYEITENEVFVKECGIYVSFSHTKPEAGEYKCFDAKKAGERLFVRSRRNGDRLVINKDGRSRKVKDILMDFKVERSERDKVPVIGGENGLLWLYPLRSCANCAADKNDGKKLYITVRRGGK